MRALVAQEIGQHMRVWPFWRCLIGSRDALVDLKPRKTADEDPVWTEPWHGRRNRVVRCEERAAEASAEAGERLGIGRAHASIDLFGAESQVEQHRGAIV